MVAWDPYMVKWVGYPREESSWVKESEMGKARGKVREFSSEIPCCTTTISKMQHPRMAKPMQWTR